MATTPFASCGFSGVLVELSALVALVGELQFDGMVNKYQGELP